MSPDSNFLGLVRDRVEAKPQKVAIVYPELKRAVDSVASRQEFYGADVNIYGSFPDIQLEIESAFARFNAHDA